MFRLNFNLSPLSSSYSYSLFLFLSLIYLDIDIETEIYHTKPKTVTLKHSVEARARI
jgi:hypothetical protein